MGGDAAFLGILVEAFAEESDTYLQTLEQALARGDAETFAEAAHGLKGAVGSLQSEAGRTMAARLEALGRAGQLDAARPALRQMKTVIDRLETRLLALKEKTTCRDAVSSR